MQANSFAFFANYNAGLAPVFGRHQATLVRSNQKLGLCLYYVSGVIVHSSAICAIIESDKLIVWRVAMPEVIETRQLTKHYGANPGLLDLDMTVERGEVFGYLGPNGAGKTTTIRLLLDLIRPTRGSAKIFGLDSRQKSAEVRAKLGYLPGELVLYDKLSGEELLRYFASLRGGVEWDYVKSLAERFECDLSKHIRSLSKGNKQKVGLIQAFMHRPELLLLDEPTSGLDPIMQQHFYSLIKECKAEGRTVLLSSHIMPEVEHICDRVGIIRSGKLIAVEEVDKLKESALRRLEIHFASPVAASAFARLPGVKEASFEGHVLYLAVVGSIDAVIKEAAKYEVVNVVSRESNLEEIFLTYYGGGENGAQHSS